MNLKHTLELEVYRKADNPTRTFDHFRNMALRYKKSKNYNPDSYIVWLEELANRPKIMYNVGVDANGRVCTICGEYKSWSEFYREKGQCRECCCEYHRFLYRKKIGK